MHNAILERVKWSLHVKMINLEKIKYEKCQSPPLLRRPAPEPGPESSPSWGGN